MSLGPMLRTLPAVSTEAVRLAVSKLQAANFRRRRSQGSEPWAGHLNDTQHGSHVNAPAGLRT